MTETSILPGAGPAPEADHEEPPIAPDGDETSEGGDNRRLLLIVGAVAGVILVAVVAFLLLHKGKSSDDASFVPTSAATKATTAPTTATSAAPSTAPSGSSTTTSVPKVQKVLDVRNPFVPLVVVAPSTASVPASSTSSVPATPTAPASGIASSTPSPSSSSPVVVQGIGSPQSVRLIGTKGDVATFNIGYAHNVFRRYAVTAPTSVNGQGTVFDTIFSLIGIQGNSVTMVIGDGTPFDLSPGVVHNV